MSFADAMQSMQDMNTQEYDLKQIFHKVREVSKKRKCKEALELILKLQVDPTQGD